LQELLEPQAAPLVAGDLLHEINVAKFAAGGLPRFFCGLAAGGAVARGHLQMRLDFLLEVRLLPGFSPQWKAHDRAPYS
jgi:hypothetical protein